MQTDPSRDWQGLTELYSKKPDGELYELAEDFGNLTEVAQQVLRSEMEKRGLEDLAAPKPSQRRPLRSTEPREGDDEDAEGGEGEESGHEFTWKTQLCTCNSREQAWQIAEALRREGIESWIETGQNVWEQSSPRLMVAADELDVAREVLTRPIPQEIVDASTRDVPEYEAPSCPACGAADPVLQDVDPTNTWLCEACGKEWSEGAEGEAEEAREAGS